MPPQLSTGSKDQWLELEIESHQEDDDSSARVLDRRSTLKRISDEIAQPQYPGGERSFVVRSLNPDSSPIFNGHANNDDDVPLSMAKLLDSMTSICLCRNNKMRMHNQKSSFAKHKVVYPVQAFLSSLDSPHLVRKRRRSLKKEHFFRPVSEDELSLKRK